MPVTELAAEDETKARVEDLLVQLLACLETDLASCVALPKLHAVQEVLLDLCLEGQRYTLIRVPPPLHEHANLSTREQEIVRLVCEGLPNKAISEVLEISPWTVGSYLKRIFIKLDVGSRAEMVARVLQEGLLDQESRELPVHEVHRRAAGATYHQNGW